MPLACLYDFVYGDQDMGMGMGYAVANTVKDLIALIWEKSYGGLNWETLKSDPADEFDCLGLVVFRAMDVKPNAKWTSPSPIEQFDLTFDEIPERTECYQQYCESMFRLMEGIGNTQYPLLKGTGISLAYDHEYERWWLSLSTVPYDGANCYRQYCESMNQLMYDIGNSRYLQGRGEGEGGGEAIHLPPYNLERWWLSDMNCPELEDFRSCLKPYFAPDLEDVLNDEHLDDEPTVECKMFLIVPEAYYRSD